MTERSLEEKIAACPPRLQEIIEEFREVDPRERLEYLLEYALEMPDLPEWLHARRDQMEQVHECQTPVFVYTELGEDGVHFYIDVPRESPTVRGYAAIVQEGLDGAAPEDVLQVPDDLPILLGLNEALSYQRLRGLYALLSYLKRQVSQRLAEKAESSQP